MVMLTLEMVRFAAAGGLVATGLACAAQTFLSVIRIPRRRENAGLPELATPVFLFQDDSLVDASASGAALIAEAAKDRSERDALVHVLHRQFPDLRNSLDDLRTGDRISLQSVVDPSLKVILTRDDGLTRISLVADGDTRSAAQTCGDLERASMLEELNLMRLIVRDTPQLIWREDPQGHLIWANAAYLSYADRMMPDGERRGQIWPGERLFADIHPPLPTDPRTFEGRHALQLPGEKAEHWFEVTAVPQDGSVIYFAIDSNSTVRAERAQHDFQQTLAKTFAHLSTGLAIFNKKRQLAMFNPALLDMTGLHFAFMSQRPSLDRVLDRLREMRRLPEPKNYITWREQFSALEAAAQNGTYSERWDMPDGQTFRVTGRPHPDGALAFLFEDISAEVSLTRRFRSEIETGQAVLDALPDAIAVFSSSNTLTMTNAAYDRMWQTEGDPQIQTHDLRSALRMWKSQAAPTALWREVEDFGRLRQDRPIVRDQLVLHSGRRMDCEITAISGGMTMIRFSASTERLRAPQRPRLTSSEDRLATG
ncbi:MAG: PAS-domain containing protein [Alphaproteobacteria bacterium]|nr:PAS-domain containing protein [Alphaproteobacteria bacterium]